MKTFLNARPYPLTRPQSQPPPSYHNQGYMPNGTPGPVPGAQPLQPNHGRMIQSGPVRVLCIADVRGKSNQVWQHIALLRGLQVTYVPSTIWQRLRMLPTFCTLETSASMTTLH